MCKFLANIVSWSDANTQLLYIRFSDGCADCLSGEGACAFVVPVYTHHGFLISSYLPYTNGKHIQEFSVL